MSERWRRFRAGAVVSLVAQLLTTGGQVLLVPLFLRAWGEQRYGEWLSLAAVVAYASIADLGFSTFVVNRLNQERAREDREAYARTLHSGLRFSLLAAAGVFAAVLAIAALAPFDRWLGFEETSRRTAFLACALLGLQVTASIPRGLVTGLYRTIGEYPRGVVVANLQRLATILSSACVLVAGGGLVVLAAIQLMPLAGVFAWTLVDLRRRHPELSVGISRSVPGMARSFLGPSLCFLGVQASLVLVLQGSTLLVGLLFGAGSVAVFASLRTLANLVRQVTTSLSNALWPELTTIAARGESRLLAGVHRTAVKSLSTLSLAAAGFLVLAGRELFLLWTGGRLDFDAALFGAFLALLVVQSPWTASAYVLLATNQHSELARRQLLAAVLGLAAGGTLAHSLGPSGIVWGLLGVELFLCGRSVPRMVTRLAGDDPRDFERHVLGRGLVVVGIAAATVGLAHPLVQGRSWALVIPVAGILGCSAAVLPAWYLWFTADERARLARFLLPRRGRRTGEPAVALEEGLR